MARQSHHNHSQGITIYNSAITFKHPVNLTPVETHHLSRNITALFLKPDLGRSQASERAEVPLGDDLLAWPQHGSGEGRDPR